MVTKPRTPQTLEQIRAANPQLAELDDHTIMVGIYNRDFAGTMTPEQYQQATGYQPQASIGDYVKSAAAGAGDLVAAAGYGLEKLGADRLGGVVREAGQTAQQYWVDDMSAAGRQVAGNAIVNDDYSLGDTPIQSTLMAASRSAPGMVVTAPVGGVVGMAAKAGLGRLAVGKAAQLAAEAGTANLAQKAVLAAPGALGMGLAEGGQAGLMNAEQTHAQIMDLTATPEDALVDNPLYRTVLQQTRDPLAARSAVANAAADEVLGRTMASTAGLGILTGGGALGSVFNRATAGGTRAAARGLPGMARDIATDVGKEAGQEFLQSGAEQYIQNAAENRQLNPGADNWQGVGPAALSGAAVGGLMGGATNVLGKPFEARAGGDSLPALNREPAPALGQEASPATGLALASPAGGLPAVYQPGRTGDFIPAAEPVQFQQQTPIGAKAQFNVAPDGTAAPGVPVPPELQAIPNKSGTLYTNRFGVSAEQMAEVAPREQFAQEVAAHTQRRDGALNVINKLQAKAAGLQGEELAAFQAQTAPIMARAQKAWQESGAMLERLQAGQIGTPQEEAAPTQAAEPGDQSVEFAEGTAAAEAISQEEPAAAPVAKRKRKAAKVQEPAEMSDQELTERASYLQEEAKKVGGFTPMLAVGLKEVRAEQDKRARKERQPELPLNGAKPGNAKSNIMLDGNNSQADGDKQEQLSSNIMLDSAKTGFTRNPDGTLDITPTDPAERDRIAQSLDAIGAKYRGNAKKIRVRKQDTEQALANIPVRREAFQDGHIEHMHDGSAVLQVPQATERHPSAEAAKAAWQRNYGPKPEAVSTDTTATAEQSPPVTSAKPRNSKQDPAAMRWAEMTLADREQLALASGEKGIFATRLAEKRWEKIPEAKRNLLATRLQAPSLAPDMEAPAELGENSPAADAAPPTATAVQSTANTDDIDSQANEAATSPENDRPEPSQAQKEAGNYKLGHIKAGGLDISVENPRGSTRSGTDKDGKAWRVDMAHHYGYIKRTEGSDGDHIDVFVGESPDSDQVFVIDQVDPETGEFDEHKVMLGFESEAEARQAYQDNYAKGWKGLGTLTATTLADFKGWLAEGDTKAPFAGDAEIADFNNLPTFKTQAQADRFVADHPELNTRDRITLVRVHADKPIEVLSFARGDTVRAWLSGSTDNGNVKWRIGQITGISQAKRAVMLDGQETAWALGGLYKAEPGDIPRKEAKPTTPLSKVVEAVNAKHGEGITEDDRVHQPTWENFGNFWNALIEGKGSVASAHKFFDLLSERKAEFVADIGTMKVDELRRRVGWGARPDDKKADLVEKLYRQTLARFTLNKEIPAKTWSMGDDLAKVDAAHAAKVAAIVHSTTEADLAEFRQQIADYQKGREEKLAAVKNPTTLAEFREAIQIRNGSDWMTSEQQARFDQLAADDSRAKRSDQKAERAAVKVAGQVVDATIVETKHTKHGHDLFVVRMAERVDRAIYDQLNASAKKLGGSYSSFRGNGAVPGFQFRNRDAAEAFVQLAGGDASAAQAQVDARRDTYADDKAQTTTERLAEMAEALEQRALNDLNRDRKTNTAKRAREAGYAEQVARGQLQFARTLRNIADALHGDGAKYLDGVRAKTHLETLLSLMGKARQAAQAKALAKAKEAKPDMGPRDEQRLQEELREQPTTVEMMDEARYPSFTIYRSDVREFARGLEKLPGTKLLANRLVRATESRDEYHAAAAKEPFTYALTVNNGMPAAFKTKKEAERVLVNSRAKGSIDSEFVDLVHVPKGPDGLKYWLMHSASAAQERGLWTENDRKPITLHPDDVADALAKAEAHNKANEATQNRHKRIYVPYSLEGVRQDRQRLQAANIHTGNELRAALRQLVDLRGEAPKQDKVRALIRGLAGQKNLGVDFFPTPQAVAADLVRRADIAEGMRVLEPSAGYGAIADEARDMGADVDVVEMSSTLREILEAKGYALVGSDFLDLAEGDYDRIVMNPPFGGGADIAHVRHAYSLLKPGGKLVAIMGEGAFSRQDKQAEAFRTWLDELGGHSEKLPAGTFLDSALPVTTGANARVVEIEKPDESVARARRTSNNGIYEIRPDVDYEIAGQHSATQGRPAGHPAAARRHGSDARLRQFESSLSRAAKRPVHTQPVNLHASPNGRALQELADSIRERFGREVTYFYADDPIAPGGGYFPQTPNSVYINLHSANSRQLVTTTVGHELMHAMRHSMPGLYRQLHQGLSEFLADRPDYLQEVIADYQQSANITPDQALLDEELLADVAGQLFTTDDFWQRFQSYRRPTVIQALKRWISRWLEKVFPSERPAPISTAGLGAHTALFDIGERMKDEIAKAYASLSINSSLSVAPKNPPLDRDGRKPLVGVSATEVRKLVDMLRLRWHNAPSITVVETASELPLQFRGQASEAQGFLVVPEPWGSSRQVFLVADKLQDMDDAEFVLMHEVMGHDALRITLGDKLPRVLQSLYAGNAVIRELADEMVHAHGYSVEEATEEVLADLAAEDGIDQINGITRVIAAIRAGLRALGMVRNWTKGDILALMAKARRNIEDSPRSGPIGPNGAPSSQRFSKTDETRQHLAAKPAGSNKHGPIFEMPGFTLHATKHHHDAHDGDFADASTLPFGHAAYLDEAAEAYDFVVRDENDADVAIVQAQVKAGKIVAIHDIDVKPGLRKGGIGGRIMAGIVAANPSGVEIIDMIPTARQWWREMGVESETTAEHDFIQNGRLDWRSLAGSTRGQAIIIQGSSLEQREATESGRNSGAPAVGIEVEEVDFAEFQRLMQSRAKQREITAAIGAAFQSDRTFNRWWHRTVGTQYHKATVSQAFKRVFDAGQAYLHDVSRLSMRAEGEAPNLLPKIGDLRELVQNGKNAFSKARKEAVKAASSAVFAGTLQYTRDEDGKLHQIADGIAEGAVFTDAELRELFKLDEQAIGIYRESRAAIDTSLDDVARSTLFKMLRESALNPLLVESLRTTTASLQDLKATIGAALTRAAQDQARVNNSSQAARILKLAQLVDDVVDKAESLKGRGYAPLMRFGNYAVDVTDRKGDRIAFQLFESQLEANMAAFKLAKEFPKAVVRQSVLSESGYKLFKGLTPETIALFAKELGLDKDGATQEYLQLAVSNRSALKRMIHRKGVEGYSEDLSRVVASFIVSNARQASGHYNRADMLEAAEECKGDVKDEAVNLVQYLTEPKEEAAALRGFMFLHFLGGSVASAAVNLTQPAIMTYPYLAQFGGAAKAAKRLASAATRIYAKAQPAELAKALERAEADGIVAPHEIHQLMAEAGGTVLDRSPGMRSFKAIWGSMFAMAESVNRRMTFIAAFETAEQEGIKDPYRFAEKAVNETQGLYNRGNRPNWARGVIGATVFTFKQYSISYLEMFKRMDRQGQAIALAVLLLAAGLQGLPFAEDIQDLIDTLGRFMGYDTDSEAALRRAVVEGFGQTLGGILLDGGSALPGMPLDVQGRLGLGNLLPGTRLLTPFENNKTDDIAQFIGPVGGLMSGAGKAFGNLASGNVVAAMQAIAPVAIQNLAKGADMAVTGMYRDTRGRKVIDTDTLQAIIKGIGFQPREVADVQRAMGEDQRRIELQRTVKASISDQMAQAMALNDAEGAKAARERLREWNARNPDTPVQINRTAIARRVKEIRMSKADRIAKRAPKELRGRLGE